MLGASPEAPALALAASNLAGLPARGNRQVAAARGSDYGEIDQYGE